MINDCISEKGEEKEKKVAFGLRRTNSLKFEAQYDVVQCTAYYAKWMEKLKCMHKMHRETSD